MPPLHPETKQPVTPEYLASFTPTALLAQDISQEQYIEIPEPVRDIYKLWRPTPFFSGSPPGAGAPDSSPYLLQIRGSQSGLVRISRTRPWPRPFTAKQEGIKDADDGNGVRDSGVPPWLWPAICSGLAARCIWSASRISKKPYRRHVITTYGAEVFASPSDRTEVGRRFLWPRTRTIPAHWGWRSLKGSKQPKRPGGQKKYSLGSFLPACVAASDHYRRRGPAANGDGRRVSGHCDRLRWRGLEFCRLCLSLCPRRNLSTTSVRVSSRLSRPPARP